MSVPRNSDEKGEITTLPMANKSKLAYSNGLRGARAGVALVHTLVVLEGEWSTGQLVNKTSTPLVGDTVSQTAVASQRQLQSASVTRTSFARRIQSR